MGQVRPRQGDKVECHAHPLPAVSGFAQWLVELLLSPRKHDADIHPAYVANIRRGTPFMEIATVTSALPSLPGLTADVCLWGAAKMSKDGSVMPFAIFEFSQAQLIIEGLPVASPQSSRERFLLIIVRFIQQCATPFPFPRPKSSKSMLASPDAWSRKLVDRIDDESVRFFRLAFADLFLWDEALEGLEPTGEIVGSDEVGEMLTKLIAALTV